MELFDQFTDTSNGDIKGKVFKRLFLVMGDKARKQRVNQYHKKLKIVDLVTLLLVLSSAIFGVSALEENLFFVNVPEGFEGNYCLNVTEPIQTIDEIILGSAVPCFYEDKTTVTVLRSLNTVFTIGIEICLVIRYFLILEFTKVRLFIRPEDSLITTGYFKFLILELVINLIHTPPGINGYMQIPQRTAKNPGYIHVNVVLIILHLFFRSYHIFKYFSFHSRWYSYESEKICLECQTPLDYLFSLKAEFKERPFFIVGCTMIISIFIFGYSLRGIEMSFMASSGQDWRYYWNGLWCIIITMAAVGFGDFYPVSLLGRFIVIIASLWGTFLISLMVAAMTVSIEFNSQEAISYDSIKAAHFELEFGTTATALIQNAMRYRWVLAKEVGNRDFKQNKSIAFQKLRKSLYDFRRLRRRKVDSLEAMLIEMSVNKIELNLTTELDKINSQLKHINEIQLLLEEYSQNQSNIKSIGEEIYKDLEELIVIKEKMS